LAQTAVGQAGRLAAEPQIVTIARQDLQPIPPLSLAIAERRALLNKALAKDGDPHDVILELTRIGDATSVPPLIEALAKLGRVPREGTYGAIDTHFHCLDALQAITNQDAGRNAEDWRAWYEANKEKTRSSGLETASRSSSFRSRIPRTMASAARSSAYRIRSIDQNRYERMRCAY
jgi:hypothetical protein